MNASGMFPKMSPEEYLAWEDQQEGKHEYSWGEVTAMAGASFDHSRVVMRLSMACGAAAREAGCQALGSDMRVAADEENYFYPDLSLVCGDPEIVGPNPGSLANPLVVVEVLSPSTEARDRSLKLDAYRSIPSVASVLLVSISQRRVEAYSRSGSNWIYQGFVAGEAVVDLPGWTLTLSLDEIYEGFVFEEMGS